MIQYLLSKYGLKSPQVADLHWNIIHTRFKTMSPAQQRFASKLMYGWLPSRQLISRYSQTSASCPHCPSPDSSDHFLYCPQCPFDWDKYQALLLKEASTPKHSVTAVTAFVAQMRQVWSHPDLTTHAIPNRLIMRGLWPKSWLASLLNAPVSSAQLLKDHWQFCHDQWHRSCQASHSSVNSTQTSALNDQILHIFRLNAALPSAQQIAFPHPPSHYCELPVPSQKAWLHVMKPRLLAKHAARRAQERLNTHAIGEFFPSLREPD